MKPIKAGLIFIIQKCKTNESISFLHFLKQSIMRSIFFSSFQSFVLKNIRKSIFLFTTEFVFEYATWNSSLESYPFWIFCIHIHICSNLIRAQLRPLLYHVSDSKVHIFWEGRKILRNLHLTFDYSTLRSLLNEQLA